MEHLHSRVVLGFVICTVLNAAREEILVVSDDLVSYNIGAIFISVTAVDKTVTRQFAKLIKVIKH